MFIFEKPWLTTGTSNVQDLRSREEKRLSQTKVGLRFLISAMSVLFFLVCVAYVVRMKVTDWQPLTDPWILWINTTLLILSSFAMHRAVLAARLENKISSKKYFLAAGLFAWVFLAGQLWAWQILNELGYYLASNPANTFFYMVTAIHAVHLLGGLGVWVYSMVKMRQDFEMVAVRSSMQLCATYWHFLLAVWIVLYSLLLLT